MTDAYGVVGGTQKLQPAKALAEPSLLFQPILDLFASDGMLLLGRSGADGPWRPLVSISVQCRSAEIALDNEPSWRRRGDGAGFWRQPRSGGQLKLGGLKILDGTPAGREVNSAICGMMNGERNRQYLIVLVRQAGEEPFTNDAAEKLRTYAPHLRTLLELGLSARQEQFAAHSLKQTIDALSPAIFGTDGRAKLWLTNESADEYLAEGTDFRVKDGVLQLAGQDSTHALHDGIWRAAHEGSSLKGGYVELSLQRQEQPDDLRVLVRPLPSETSGRKPSRVLVIVPGAREARLLEHLTSRFDLTLAEAKLAHRLASGSALREAAESLGIREQTARTYLKRVFHKTQTCRQAELVHKIAVEPLLRPFGTATSVESETLVEALGHWRAEQ